MSDITKSSLFKKLSKRAKNILFMLDVKTIEDLQNLKISKKDLLKFSNCGIKTAEELVNFIENSSKIILEENSVENSELSTRLNNYLLIRILKRISISEIDWNFKTYKLIEETNGKSLYDLAMISQNIYQNYKSYNKHSFLEIKSEILKVVQEINSFSTTSITLNIFKSDTNENILFIPYNNKSGIRKIKNSNSIDLFEIVDVLFSNLNELEKQVIQLYYGMDSDPHSLQSIALLTGLTRERVRQIKSKANNKMRNIKRLRFLYKNIKNLYEQFILELLQKRNGRMLVEEIKYKIFVKFNYTVKEIPIFNWFSEIIGTNWFCMGSIYYKADFTYCKLLKKIL